MHTAQRGHTVCDTEAKLFNKDEEPIITKERVIVKYVQ